MEYTEPDAFEHPGSGQHQENDKENSKEDLKDRPGRQWIFFDEKQITADSAYYDSSLFT